MTVLVTGGGGFIGSHLVDHLLAKSTADIRVLDDFSTGDPINLQHIDDDRLTIVRGDIRNLPTVYDVVEDVNVVYHLAAAVGVEKVVDDPLDTLQTNLKGTENILQAANDADVPTFIASSSEVYGKSKSLPLREDGDRLLGPTDIPRWGYASSKAIDESLALSYHEQHRIPIIIGRYFNIVGPRQTGQYGMVIPRFVEQALSGEPLTVHGDGNQTRSFTHVHDAVELTHTLLDSPAAHGEVVNIGSPHPTSINHLAERVIELTESDSEIRHVPFEEVYGEDFEEPSQREPDVKKLRDLAGWVPEANLDRILRDVIAERQTDDAVAVND